MSHYRSLNELTLQNTWLTIGVFDGVHLGHRALLRQLVDGARAAGSPAAVITFHPHPAVVLGGKAGFAYLTPPDEKAALLTGLGVDTVITQEFSREFAEQTAEDYMRTLARTLNLRHLVIGYDTALGRGREGNAARLTEISIGLGFGVETAAPVSKTGQVISSSAIRAQVREGTVAQAAEGLGRWYAVSGPVVHGDGRGRTINIPTANIQVPAEKLIPANGVYATWAWVDGERHPAVTNIGVRPTFTPEKLTANIESHLLDYTRDLYGQDVKLEFVERLRGEQKFVSVDALVSQIRLDIARSKEYLKVPECPG